MSDPYVPSIGHPPPSNSSTSRQSTGDDAPSDADGDDGDEYIRKSNGAIYTKSNGTWTVKA